jgi:AraC family transcriptional regulator
MERRTQRGYAADFIATNRPGLASEELCQFPITDNDACAAHKQKGAEEIVSDRIWLPNHENDVHSGGIRAMHGGPTAMRLPEHAHVETQVQVRFRKFSDQSDPQPVEMSLHPPLEPHTGGWEENWEVVVFLLTPRLMSTTADDLLPQQRFQIRPYSKIRSPLVEQLAQAVRREFCSPFVPSRLFVESVGQVLAAHVLRAHADTNGFRSVRGRLSASQLRQIDDFIDSQLDTEFGVEDLGAIVKLSPQRFSEQFRRATRTSPWRYVQSRRLEKARNLLMSTRLPLVEIAFRLGFASQSHFTNVFKRGMGMTPQAFRNETSSLRLQT